MASKRRLRRKTCGDKQSYPSQEAAALAMRRHGIHGECLAYPCKFCGSWHFGHPSRLIKRAALGEGRIKAHDHKQGIF